MSYTDSEETDDIIPFSPPDITEEDILAVADTLRSGWITTGPAARQLAQDISDHTGAGGAFCLSSGTAALAMALRMLEIGPGDEVIVPAYTFTATAGVVLDCGATPVAVDSLPDSYNIDPCAADRAFTARTKAIIATDIGGLMADYSALRDIADSRRSGFSPSGSLQHTLGRPAVIADAAHSLGAIRNGRHAGAAADLTAFSFHAVKNLTTAEGGALTWNDGIDSSFATRFCRLHCCHGIDRDAEERKNAPTWEYDVTARGSKCNLPDTLAALGLSQLRRYDSILQRRFSLISIYDSILADSGATPLIHSGEGFRSSGHLYMVQLPEYADRDDVFRRMHKAGICCNVHFKPLPLLTVYRGLSGFGSAIPNALRLFLHELTLPLYTRLSDCRAQRVAMTLCDILKNR